MAGPRNRAVTASLEIVIAAHDRPPPPEGVDDGPRPLSPTAFLEDVQRRLVGTYDGPVVVEGRIVGTRRARGGWLNLELGDAEPAGGYETRLSVSLPPAAAGALAPDTIGEQTLVQVTGRVRLWIARAQVQLLASEVVRVGHSQTQATFDAAAAAITTERLGEVVPALPRFLRRILLLAPVGTTLGDLTRDLGGWQPPTIVHRSIPGDSPDLHHLLGRYSAEVDDADLVVIARGGAIEAISGWDAVELLRGIDALQRAGRPVLVAVGHADHTPLVYRVAGYTVRHTAEAGRWLADHNRTAAARIEALAQAPAVLGRALEWQRERLERTGSQLHMAVGAHLTRRRNAVDSAEGGLRVSLAARHAHLARRLGTARGVAPLALARSVHDRARRLEVASATLDGFRTGIALLAAEDGGPATLVPGARIRIEVADATALATVDEVTRYDESGGPAAAPTTTSTTQRSAAPTRSSSGRRPTRLPAPDVAQLDLLGSHADGQETP